MLNYGGNNSFFDYFSDYLNTLNHFNFNYPFWAILQVFKFEFQKFRILEILNFHPWSYVCHISPFVGFVMMWLDFNIPILGILIHLQM